MVDVEVPGGTKLTVEGLAVSWKSTTWKRIVPVAWVRLPSVPVTVTV